MLSRLLERVKDKDGAAAAVGAVAAAASLGYVLYRKLHIPGSVKETTRHGGDLVAQVLKAHGVEFVFTLVGGHISPILVASKHSGIKVVDVRHEATAVFAADAVARLSGVPGVAAVTAGPGLTNTITAVKNAQMAESPVVLISGAAATVVKGRGALQDIDQMSVVKSIVKFSATCTTLRDIVPTLRRAFQEAMSGVPGPVFVEFPIDVLYNIGEIRANMGLCTRKRVKELKPLEHSSAIVPEEYPSFSAYIESRSPDAPVFLKKDVKLPFFVHKYLDYKLRNLFSGAFDKEFDASPLPVSIPLPSSRQISKAKAMLLAAKKPVMIVASQATLFSKPPGSTDEPIDALRAAVEQLGVPTFLSGMARGLLGADGKLHIRQNRRAALKDADLIILAGAVCDFRLDYGRTLPRSAKIIAVNRNPASLSMNTDLFWKPTLGCLADPATFLIDLAAATGSCVERFAAHAASLKSSQFKKEEANNTMSKQAAFGRNGKQLINPLALCREIDAALPDKSILVTDGGDFIGTAAYVVRPRGPLCWLDPGAFGTLGVGGGFALGAALCRPDHQVWLLWGDGSCGYSVAEFDTFKRHGVNLIAVVGNDSSWTQIEREQVPIFNDSVACPLLYTDYGAVAAGYGGRGATVASPSEDVASVLKEAQEDVASGNSVLVNVHIGSTSFREGSISV